MSETERVDKLKKSINDSFLVQLVEVARLYGWEGDHFEISYFVKYLHHYGNKACPDLEPYDIS